MSSGMRAGAYILLLVALTVAVRLPLLTRHHAIDDEVNYSVVARQLMDGGVLYQDVVERRPPATFWVYSAIFRAFGTSNWFALHVAGTVWVLLTMLALYVIGMRLFGARSGYVAALLYGLFQPWWYWGNLALNGEVLMNLPVAAACALCLGASSARAPRFLFAGAMIALAFLLKQPAAVAIVPLVIYALHPARDTRLKLSTGGRIADVMWLLAGSTAVVAGVGLWLYAHHILQASLYWSIFDHDVPLVFWDKALERTLAFAAVTFPMLAASWWSLAVADLWVRHRAERDAVVSLLVVSAIGAAASGRFYPHYYIGTLPALCVLAAAAASRPLSAWTDRTRWLPHTAAAWIGCVVVATFVNQSIVGAREVERSEAALYIRDHSAADARVFVWGRTPRIYLDSDRRPAARYIDNFALTGRIFGPPLKGVDTTARIRPGAWDQLKQDFQAHPPMFIVDAESGKGAVAEYPIAWFPWLSELLQRDYAAVAEADDGVVYKRRDRAEVARASE